MGKASPVFVLLIAALSATAAAEETVLNIGAGHVPPITELDSNGRLSGFAVDVVNEAARREHLRLNWRRAGTSHDIERALDRGQLDLVPAGMVTPERQQKYFVSEPWWFAELTVVTRRDSGIRSAVDLPGRRLGLASPIYALPASKAYPRTTLLPFDDSITVTAAVCRGELDAGLITHGYLDDMSLVRPEPCNGVGLWAFASETITELAVIARRDREAVARRLRARIDDMALDGTLASMAARHPPIPTSGALNMAEGLRRRYQSRVWAGSLLSLCSLLILSGWFLLKQTSTQRRLRYERELFRGAIDHIPVMIAIREPRSADWKANPEFERLLGSPSDTSLPPMFGADEAARPATAWHDCNVMSKDGERVPTSWAKVRLSRGTCVAIGLDLRERMRSEEALRESEQRLRLAMEATNLGAFDFNPRTGKIMWSGAAMQQFGLTGGGGEVTYETFLAGIHPDDRDRVDHAVNDYLQQGWGEYAAEYRTIGLEDGKERWISCWGRAFCDEQDHPVRLLGVRLDVTERRRAEDAIRRQAELINLSHDAIITAGENRVITGWNAGASEMYGWTEDQAVGRIVDELLRTEAAPSTSGVDNVLGGDGLWDGLLVHTRSDGRKLTVESRQVLVRDGAGRPAGFLEINRDITERVRAEQQLRELNAELELRVTERTQELAATNRELEAFAYSVSHDLRAPLRGIDGWSLALLEDCAGGLDERGQEYLGRVRSETQRMGRLIEEMLKLARVARVDMEFAPVDLSALALDIARRFREAHPERDIAFRVAPRMCAEGDRHLLEIGLTNLFDNAVKFTAKSACPLVDFGQRSLNGDAVFYVQDNGVGFDMAYAHKLFGPFQRLHTDSEFPGIGVGLATVQRVIHRHRGRIWAESEAGRGATFYFVLGSALAHAAASCEPARAARAGADGTIDNGVTHVQYSGIRKI